MTKLRLPILCLLVAGLGAPLPPVTAPVHARSGFAAGGGGFEGHRPPGGGAGAKPGFSRPSRPSRPPVRPGTRPTTRPAPLPAPPPETRPPRPEPPDRPGIRPPEPQKPGFNPGPGPIVRPGDPRPPGFSPAGRRPPGYRPPYHKPPYQRPPHPRWGRYYWSPAWGWYFFVTLPSGSFVYIDELPEGCQEGATGSGELRYICGDAVYAPTFYDGTLIYVLVS
ncbi:hypothetical protein [Oceanomicrobium pacificus]|uniref:Uncharacterized protein n=1 Tax=Oceanomicrobium pacificus TaxID=2692916 RepID=A0A6B0TUT4_9RHOB|nr:hypothetical protein [Oceanomicrobium pacificus]MXU66569.1 hypothetical protein [Oceanomicrobium pacificus]